MKIIDALVQCVCKWPDALFVHIRRVCFQVCVSKKRIDLLIYVHD
jgi:hypothetical protein